MAPETDATSPTKAPSTSKRRLTVSLTERDTRKIEDLAEDSDLSNNDVIRRAISVDHYVRKQKQAGFKILLESPDGSVREVEFVD